MSDEWWASLKSHHSATKHTTWIGRVAEPSLSLFNPSTKNPNTQKFEPVQSAPMKSLGSQSWHDIKALTTGVGWLCLSGFLLTIVSGMCACALWNIRFLVFQFVTNLHLYLCNEKFAVSKNKSVYLPNEDELCNVTVFCCMLVGYVVLGLSWFCILYSILVENLSGCWVG